MERKLYRVTGPQYIGRTGMKVQERWRNHRAWEATEHPFYSMERIDSRRRKKVENI